MSKSTKKVHSNAVVSPVTDAILTGIFFLLIGYSCMTFYNYSEDHIDLYFFFACCAGVFCAIKITEFFCAKVMRDIISAKFLIAGPEPHPLGNPASYTKFIATSWQLVIHMSMTLLETYILWDETWLSHPYTSFIPVIYRAKDSLRFFYILQVSIWIMTCISHRFNSDAHAHKDYVLMYVHHLATIALVSLSFAHDQTRVGLVVLFLHDCSDIGIDILKLSNYLLLEGPSAFFLTEAAYALTMSTWFYFRLWYFPIHVIYKGTLWGLGYIGAEVLSVGGDLPPIFTLPYGSDIYKSTFMVGTVCSVLLILLFIMHIWWFVLLGKILFRILKNEDKRKIAHEEYEGDFAEKFDKNGDKKDQIVVKNNEPIAAPQHKEQITPGPVNRNKSRKD